MSTQDEDALELAVESALAEYLVRCDAGDAPDREAFLAKNPAMRERLEELLAAADWIEQMAGPTMASLAVAPPSDPNEETHPLLPIAVSVANIHANASQDPNAVTLPSSAQGGVPSFSLGSLTPAQELARPVLPCRFGEYMLEKVLGRGGMGVVYAGRQVHLDRAVAIKMIRSGALASVEEVQRFYTEARSAAQLDHPNIVTVYQCGEHEGHHYFSMDMVEGSDLAKSIQGGPMDGRRAARYVRDVARAIQYAHDRGILHRDLKPANVLVDKDDQVHVTDFGLAKSIGSETGLTATGAALGTPSYMSPEQAAGRVDEHDFQTDVYSMGAVLFALVTGKPPFQASSVVQTLMQVLHRPAPLARQVHSGVDVDMETIIAKCLHKSPERRYATAGELADDLQRYLNNEPIQARPLSVMRRVIYWSIGIPIISALVGKRVVEPTAAHTWAQRGLLVGFLAILLALFTLWPSSNRQVQRMPSTIHFAAGQRGGSYDFVSRVICEHLSVVASRPAVPETTEGSIDNRQRLINRNVDLALLQASTLNSNQIAVVAPLYYEAIHVLARIDSGITSIEQLVGRRVIVGPEGSGSRVAAKRLLQRQGLELDSVQAVASEWLSMDHHPEAEAAIVVVQVGNSRMNELLGSGPYRLLPIKGAVEFALEDPAYHVLPLTREHYPDATLPREGLECLATTAYLATRVDSPNILVRKALEAIYSPEVLETCKLLRPEKVADWQVSWHPAANAFFEAYRSR